MISTSDLGTAIADLRGHLDPKQVSIGDVDLDSEVRDYVSTQCPLLDIAIGRPGIPVGRLTTIIGLEASGKSTVGLHLLAETQQRGGIAVLADTEKRYWKERAERLGLDQDLLLRLSGETVEEVFDQIHKTIDDVRAVLPDHLITIVWDSLAGTPTNADIKADAGEFITANYSRIVRPALRKLHTKVATQNIALVFINQLSQQIDFGGFGRPKLVMVAEKALTYWSSVKIDLTQVGRLGEKDTPSGIQVKANVVKNTVAPPFRTCVFEIDFNTGINRYGAALDAAVGCGLIVMKGGWYKWGERSFRKEDFTPIYDSDEELRLMVAMLPTAWAQLLKGGDDA